jgi:hypothetical protein
VWLVGVPAYLGALAMHGPTRERQVVVGGPVQSGGALGMLLGLLFWALVVVLVVWLVTQTRIR